MSYESPIRLIEDKAKIEIEDMVVRAVKSYGLTIDKDALIKALNYDREQYEKGFEDGKATSIETEAIPIEWIRKYTEENRLYQSDDFDIYINDMIADWAERETE